MSAMRGPRVLLADDHALLLAAVEKLLADECTIVGQVADGRALVNAAEKLRPDVIVLDVEMPSLNGLEAARQLKQRLKNVKLVFLTMHEDPDLAAEAFRAGASAYLLKRSAANELSTAIREAMQGRWYVTPLMTQELVGSLLRGDTDKASAGTHPAAARDPATSRRGPFDEAGCGGVARHAADRCLSQIPDDGASQGQVDGGAHSVRRETSYRLNIEDGAYFVMTPVKTPAPVAPPAQGHDAEAFVAIIHQDPEVLEKKQVTLTAPTGGIEVGLLNGGGCAAIGTRGVTGSGRSSRNRLRRSSAALAYYHPEGWPGIDRAGYSTAPGGETDLRPRRPGPLSSGRGRAKSITSSA